MKFDALAIGGGPAGCAAAATLAGLGYSACIVESRDSEEFKAGESIPPAVKPLLRDLGFAPACTADSSLISHGNQSAWGAPMLSDTDFIRDPNGSGWHVDRSRFDAGLRALAARAGVRLFERTRVMRVQTGAAGWRVTMQTPSGSEACGASWIVDASGRAAWFARARGAARMVHDRLVSVLAVFTAPDATDTDSRTLVESASRGWWYSSRIPGRRRIVAYHTDAGNEGARRARSPAGFLALLDSTRHIAARVSDHRYRMEDAPRTFPANTAILDRFGGPGWIAAGDAAVSFDPLASQGILTALYGGLNAARTIHDSVQGRPDALARYDRKLRDVFEAYRRNRDPWYRRETRWPEEPFWKSRVSMRDATKVPADDRAVSWP